MDDKLKKRLVGATVLASLVVIFVPMLVERRAEPPVVAPLPSLPPPAPMAFDSQLLREEVPAPEPVPGAAPDTGAADTVAVEDLEPRVGLSVWVIQVGSFSSKENADRLVQKLRAAGLDTMDADTVGLRGQTLYRVQVGPEADRARAESLLPKIKEITRLDGKILRYP